MLPRLEFKDEGTSESVGWYIDKSLQLQKAPKLHVLTVELGPHYPVDVDVGEWVENAINRGVKDLDFKLLWTADPIRFPKSLYTCETLVVLTLSNKILVDISSPAHLPYLLYLSLLNVLHKDEDSLDRLLSGSHVLKWMLMYREDNDNLKTFTVKVPSLKTLSYYDYNVVEEEDEVEDGELEDVDEVYEDDFIESLVIDSPALRYLKLWNVGKDYCLIENRHCFDKADIVVCNPDIKFLRSLSSAIRLNLFLSNSLVPCCYTTIKFSRLIEFYFFPDFCVDWFESLMFLLQNSPILKTLTIDTEFGDPPSSWNQPNTIPGCLSTHVKVFRWRDYGGKEGEKQLLTYILVNSKCFKKVEISFIATCSFEETRKEIESMPRILKSSRLLFSPRMEGRFNDIIVLFD